MSEVCKGICVDTGGDLAVVPADAPIGATTFVLRKLPCGALLQVRVRRVAVTGTTAVDSMALF